MSESVRAGGRGEGERKEARYIRSRVKVTLQNEMMGLRPVN